MSQNRFCRIKEILLYLKKKKMLLIVFGVLYEEDLFIK